MFYAFDDEEKSRLNRGVRGRLIDRVEYLIKKGDIKGYDVNEIYENTKKLKPEDDRRTQNEFNYSC
jgi:hypothetical protein